MKMQGFEIVKKCHFWYNFLIVDSKNQEKFDCLRKWGLPVEEYCITGSGLLGILNLRRIGDIDIIASEKLWEGLAKKFGSRVEKGIEKVTFPDGVVEAFRADSPYNSLIQNRIANAQIIAGLPFDPLETVLFFKRQMGREKDLRDIELLEVWRHNL